MRKRLQPLLLCAVAALFLVACQDAKKLDIEPASVAMYYPHNGEQLSVISPEQQLALALQGGANVNNDLQVRLNGTDVTSNMRISALSAFGALSQPPFDALVHRGENIVEVRLPSQAVNQTFRFYLDDMPPRLVVLNATAAPPGGQFTLTGEIVDASNVQQLVFNDGTVQPATLQGDAPKQTFTVDLTKPSVKNSPINNPEITYSITDSNGLVHKGSWVMPGTPLSRTVETFIPYTVLNSVELVANKGFSKIIDLLTDTGPVGAGPGKDNDPFNRSAPSGDFNNPSISKGAVLNYSSCAPNSTNRADHCYFGAQIPILEIQPIDAINGSLCNSQVFDRSKIDTCAFYLTDVTISEPRLDFSWNKDQSKPQLRATIATKYAGLSLQIVGLRAQSGTTPGAVNGVYDYQGALKTSVRLRNTNINSLFDVSKGGGSGNILNIRRLPGFEADITDIATLFFGERAEKPEFFNTSCDVCKLAGTNLQLQTAEFIYNFTNITVPNSSKVCPGQKVSECWKSELSKELEDRLGTALSGLASRFESLVNELAQPRDHSNAPPSLIDNVTTWDLTAARLSSHNYLENWLPNFLEPYAIGARLGFDGAVKYYQGAAPAPSKSALAFATPFVKNGGFDDWMFYDKIFPNKQPVQFAFALSSNAINQYFLSEYLTDAYDDYDIALTGADFAPVQNFGASDNYTLHFSLKQPPSVKLQPFQKQVSYGGCIEFQGMGNCGAGKEFEKIVQKEIKEQVLLDLPRVTVELRDAASSSLFKAEATMKLGALIHSGGLKPKANFADVLVTEVQSYDANRIDIQDARFVNAKLAAMISTALNSKSANLSNLLLIGGATLSASAPHKVKDISTIIGTAWPSSLSALAQVYPTPAAFFADARGGNAMIPLEIGVSLKTIRVDKGGDYVTFAGNLHPEVLTVNSCQTNQNLPAAKAEKYIAAYCFE